ncbi:MAG: hypothetical protein DWQ07_13950 [Chloroflexi bacterium]|nr:MAG: hypothetical protein DWQ07_13950 [Chloroflexota bacterium]
MGPRNQIHPRDWQRLPKYTQLYIYILVKFLTARHRLQLPRPVAFSLRTTLFAFLLLPLMPLEPMALPAVMGGATSASLIYGAIRKG